MRLVTYLGAALVLTLALGPLNLVQARAANDLELLTKKCNAAVAAFKTADSTLQHQFDTAVGYVIFPAVAKGGLVFGGSRGQGLVYAKGVLIGKATLSAVTFGAQIGGQEFAELIFFETEEALQEFKTSELVMRAQVSAVAAAEGASKNARYKDGVLVLTRAKQGLMAEASIGGQKLRFTPLPAKP